jgi:hypothetical protein
MIKFCPQCIHYRLRPPLRVLQSGSGSSPGRINAATEEMRLEKERRDSEQRRIDEDYRFDYEPSFFPWCNRYTLPAEELANIRAALLKADRIEDVIDGASAKGYELIIDPPNGVVRRVYALCRRKNADGSCPSYEEKPGAPT